MLGTTFSSDVEDLYFLILSSTLVLSKKVRDVALREPRTVTPPAALTFWAMAHNRIRDAVSDVVLNHDPTATPDTLYANVEPLTTDMREGRVAFHFSYGWHRT